jgi:DNA-binding NarL/FixJ family response regulator
MKILISSSNWLFREGLASYINSQSGCEVVGDEIIDGMDLLDRSMELKPDVILLDIDNYGDTDFRSIKKLKQYFPSISIIILASEFTESDVINALSNGARGFLSKKMSKQYLNSCFKALIKGEILLPESMVMTVISDLVDNSKNNEDKKNQMISRLTYRELEVLKCLKNEETNKEIATKLVISVNTVRIHVSNILKKLNVENRREAASVANELGQFV